MSHEIGVPCSMCRKKFPAPDLDFLGRCEPCFRIFISGPLPDHPILFQNTHNRHNKKETKAWVQRMERKRWTPQGTEHNYVKRTYV